jgi:hypothetical protein
MVEFRRSVVTDEEVTPENPEVFQPLEEKTTQEDQPPTAPKKPANVDRSQMSNEWKAANPEE